MTLIDIKDENARRHYDTFKNFLKWKNFDWYDAYYNEEAFKNIRGRFVDAALSELGVLFFAFEFTSGTSDSKDMEILSALYDKGRLFCEDPEEKVPSPQDFIFREAIPSLMNYVGVGGDGPEGKFDLVEFIYFSLDKNRPAKKEFPDDIFVFRLWQKAESSKNKVIDEEEYEPFTIRGLLAVRTLVGYEESISTRDHLCRPSILQGGSDDFSFSPITLKPLDSAEKVKEHWDSLIAPTSFLSGNANGLKEIAALHGWHDFRSLEEPNELFSQKYYRVVGGSEGGPYEGAYSFGRLYYKYADRQTFYHGLFFTYWTELRNKLGVFDPKTKTYSRSIKPNPYANIIGLPLQSSYDTPAILYNLFDIYAKISNIEFHSDLYYRKVSGRFLTPLGNELWFKQNYFKIARSLVDRFHYYVSGVDYYKLYALQIENVMTIMRVKPLEGSKKLVPLKTFKCYVNVKYSNLKAVL